MLEYFRVAAEIANAQSRLRPIDNDGLLQLIDTIYGDIKGMINPEMRDEVQPQEGRETSAASKSIRPKSITCLECGKSFRALTNPHLASHGLDAVAYREKWGLRKNLPLVCHELRRSRRRTMEGLQLWKGNSERRHERLCAEGAG